MYSLTTPPGPIPTTIQARRQSRPLKQFTIFEPPPIRKFDPNFNADTETYEGSQNFSRAYRFKTARAGPLTVTFEPRYQTCSGTSCIPPRTAHQCARQHRVAAPRRAIPRGLYRSEARRGARRPNPQSGISAPFSLWHSASGSRRFSRPACSR